MKRKITTLTSAALAFVVSLPNTVSAQNFVDSVGSANTSPLANFISAVVDFVNTILLPAVLAIAFFVFVWGIFRYFIAGGANEEARENGKNLMIYATLGFVFIVIFWGLVNFLAGTIGLGEDQLEIDQINTPGIDLPAAPVGGGVAP